MAKEKKRMIAKAGLMVMGLMLMNGTLQAGEFWSHKDWRVSADNGRCTVITGGDGDDSFVLGFDHGGLNASASYEPVVVRGYPASIAPEDRLVLLVDGEPWAVEEILAAERSNEWGDRILSADVPGGLVPTLIELLRKGNTLSLQKVGTTAPAALATFSLRGLTANLLKASAWCGFDANALPRS